MHPFSYRTSKLCGDFAKNAIDLGVERGTLLLIPPDQIHRREDFLLNVRITALVEIIAALFGELTRRKLLRLVKTVNRKFPAVIPPLDDRIEMLQLYRFRL